MSELRRLAEEIEKSVTRRLEHIEKTMGDPLIYAGPEDFDKLLSRYKVVVVEFSAPWCNPCKAYTPVFKRVARKLMNPSEGVVFVYLDTDKAPEIADRYAVDNIPTTIIFVNGHVADVIIGATQESKLEERVRNIAKEVARG